jgi:hypothetical protein
MFCAVMTAACSFPDPALTRLMEARRLSGAIHAQFATAAEAANRAVMAEDDAAATAAAAEARRARQALGREVDALNSLLQSLNYQEDLGVLARFKERFAQYERLDDEILGLAVENTNLKAQRLSFGPAREAADAFSAALDSALKTAGRGDHWQSFALAGRAVAALRRIQVLHAPHIAEADDAAMTRMEEQMAAAAAEARTAVRQLQATLPAAAAPHIAAAVAALDRFESINKELVALSRRNSDVYSLALTLGKKRTLAAECEDQLRALDEALAKHEFRATR